MSDSQKHSEEFTQPGVKRLLSLLRQVLDEHLDIAWIRQLLEELEAALGQSDPLPVFEEILSNT